MIYPNPASDKITIELPGVLRNNKDNCLILIYSITGNEILRNYFTGKKSELTISQLPEGLYFVNLMKEDKIFVGKFIKE
jgi:hypothetical protein